MGRLDSTRRPKAYIEHIAVSYGISLVNIKCSRLVLNKTYTKA